MEIKDVLGLKPVAEAGLEVTKATIEGVSSFLEIVCKPGLQEFGYLLQDKVRQWRLNNIIRTLEKAKGRMYFDGQTLQLTANARVGLSIIEECSQVDDDELQNLWAGLFASSCTTDGRDDSNMNFVDLLKRMSSVEARIIDYACRNCKKTQYKNNLLTAQTLIISFEELVVIAGTDDIYRLDSELDHMRSIELLETGSVVSNGGGFIATDEKLDANITPSPIALTLYYKTHSTSLTPLEFWKNDIVPFDENGIVEEK
ncbi:MAG: DUF4393 domain-containing protein [Salinivirgaceae bacterium]|nr:DUF4393 domain-containing protein [Salinivirgaceae bacterium]